MTSAFPKGLAKGNYQLLTGDFRDLAGNRRTDLSVFKPKYEFLPVATVSENNPGYLNKFLIRQVLSNQKYLLKLKFLNQLSRQRRGD